MAIVKSLGPRTVTLVNLAGKCFPLTINLNVHDGDPAGRDMDPSWIWGSANIECGDLKRELVTCGEDEIQLVYRLVRLCSAYLEGVKELQKVEFFSIIPGDAPATEDLFK